MSDQPRDWDKELAEIDKVIAREPAGGPPPATRVGGTAAPVAVPQPHTWCGRRTRWRGWRAAPQRHRRGHPVLPYPVAAARARALLVRVVVLMLPA